MIITTIDLIEISLLYSRFDPSGPQNGMATILSYLYVKTPNLGWIKAQTRSSIVLKEVIEGNTLSDLEFFLLNGLV